jgi:hypothetical protein
VSYLEGGKPDTALNNLLLLFSHLLHPGIRFWNLFWTSISFLLVSWYLFFLACNLTTVLVIFVFPFYLTSNYFICFLMYCVHLQLLYYLLTWWMKFDIYCQFLYLLLVDSERSVEVFYPCTCNYQPYVMNSYVFSWVEVLFSLLRITFINLSVLLIDYLYCDVDGQSMCVSSLLWVMHPNW